MKYNEIATPRPLQFLMVGVRNEKSGFEQHALDILSHKALGEERREREKQSAV